MKVLLWQRKNCAWLDQLVLWDGQCTYWSDEMKPSTGYNKIRFKWCREPMSCRFILIGDL